MRILITGATGFVGGAIAQRLREEHDVSGLARSNSSVKKLNDQGIKAVADDLMSIDSCQLKGFDIVIHCAAYVEEWGPEKDFSETNVLGTEKLLTAAKKAGVKRFIFIGTEAAFFTGDDLINIDESIQYPGYLPYPYSRTKAEAEKKVLSASTDAFQTISLRPRFVWGPGDRSVLPSIINMIKANRFAWINHGDFQISSTYIDNLVHAVVQSLSYGKGGEAYFIADDGVTRLREFLTAALGTQGIVAPNKSLPKFSARLSARFVEFSWRLLRIRKKPPLVRFSIDMMSASCTVNTAKAKENLHYQPPVTREQGLMKMAEQFKAVDAEV